MAAKGDLSRLRILVDTYNLRLREGTGIKTYGLALIEALHGLNAQVSLLTDVRKPKTKYPELDEALVFDVGRTQHRRWWRRPAAAFIGLGGTVRGRWAEQIRIERVIPDNRFGKRVNVRTFFNTPQCYKLADAAYRTTRRLTRIHLSSKVDIFHATRHLPIRVRGTKLVTTIHDLIPLKLPYSTLDDKRLFRELVWTSLRDSALIFAVSECTKRDILSFFDVPEDKIVVTYQSVPSILRPASDATSSAVLRKYQLRKHNYILFVGNIEPKKNVRALLRAVSTMNIDIPLVIVGRKAWLWEDQIGEAEALFSPHQRFVKACRFVENAPNSDLAALYANARCFVFPSLYEGFGLPPLEAMRYECPVITSKASSLPEVCGDAALYIDPREPDDIRQKIMWLLSSDTLSRQLVEAGRQRVQLFSMDRYKERILDAYSRLLPPE